MKIRKLFLITSILLLNLNLIQAQKELVVVSKPQKDRTWCWAACQEMIYAYHQFPKDTVQQIVAVGYFRIIESRSREYCLLSTCQSEIAGCSRQVSLDVLKRLVHNYGYKSYKKVDNPLWDDVKNRIDEFKPIYIAQELSSYCKSAHLLVAKGYCQNPKAKFLLTNDPGACKNQNIIALQFNTTPLVVCSAVMDSLRAPSTSHGSVIENSQTCKLDAIVNPVKTIILPLFRQGIHPKMLLSKSDIDSNSTIDLRNSVEVVYSKIIDGKLVKMNDIPLRDVFIGKPSISGSDSTGYLINRVAISGNIAKTQMIIKGQYFDGKFIEPKFTIGDKSFRLDSGQYKKIVLLDNYDDFIQFKYNGKFYYYPLTDCADCKQSLLSEKKFFKKYALLNKKSLFFNDSLTKKY
jgi:Papain-like cysteine protease AvrRpt2